MNNYLVTGAAGFIGSAITKRLLQENNNVYTIDNLSTGNKKNIPKGTIFIKGDCSDIKLYDHLKGIKFDAVFHLAGQSSGEISFEDPIYDIKSNLESTILLLKLSLSSGCKKFIYASSMSVYGSKPDRPINEKDKCVPESFYGIGKLASENYMRIFQSYGIECISLRFFNVYGPGQNLKNKKQGMISIYISQMIEDGKINVKGSSERFRDFIYINDVVEVLRKSLDLKNKCFEIINVGSGTRTRVIDLIKIIKSNWNKKITVTFKNKTQGDVFGIYSDNKKMKKLLNFNLKTPLDKGIKEMIRWSEMQY